MPVLYYGDGFVHGRPTIGKPAPSLVKGVLISLSSCLYNTYRRIDQTRKKGFLKKRYFI